MNPATQVMDG